MLLSYAICFHVKMFTGLFSNLSDFRKYAGLTSLTKDSRRASIDFTLKNSRIVEIFSLMVFPNPFGKYFSRYLTLQQSWIRCHVSISLCFLMNSSFCLATSRSRSA